MAKAYHDALKGEGWEIASTMNMGEASMVHAKKGNLHCSAMVVKDDDGTRIQLSISQE